MEKRRQSNTMLYFIPAIHHNLQITPSLLSTLPDLFWYRSYLSIPS